MAREADTRVLAVFLFLPHTSLPATTSRFVNALDDAARTSTHLEDIRVRPATPSWLGIRRWGEIAMDFERVSVSLHPFDNCHSHPSIRLGFAL